MQPCLTINQAQENAERLYDGLQYNEVLITNDKNEISTIGRYNLIARIIYWIKDWWNGSHGIENLQKTVFATLEGMHARMNLPKEETHKLLRARFGKLVDNPDFSSVLPLTAWHLDSGGGVMVCCCWRMYSGEIIHYKHLVDRLLQETSLLNTEGNAFAKKLLAELQDKPDFETVFNGKPENHHSILKVEAN